MTLHPRLRPIDRTRAIRCLTAWACDDDDQLQLVVTEADADPRGMLGLLFATLDYARWLTDHTGPLLPGDPGPHQ